MAKYLLVGLLVRISWYFLYNLGYIMPLGFIIQISKLEEFIEVIELLSCSNNGANSKLLLQPFYSSLDLVQDYMGKPVQER